MRSAHTFVELKVSREVYLEIYTLLAEAGYHHAFLEGAIDMHGIALTMDKEVRQSDAVCEDCKQAFCCCYTGQR